jgi:hypothetical protein
MTYTAITDERTTSLAAIHLSWGLPTGVEILALLNNGITLTALTRPWPVGAARVRFDGHRFELDPSGERAFTFVIFDRGEAFDIGACEPHSGRLGSWLSRGFCLDDHDWLGNPAVTWAGGALRIHASPLEWLRASREGIVILRPELSYIYLGRCRRLWVSDKQFAAKVKGWLQPPKRNVEIIVADTERTVA